MQNINWLHFICYNVIMQVLSNINWQHVLTIGLGLDLGLVACNYA